MHRIIHHTDLDGFASAAIVAYNLIQGRGVPRSDIWFVPINYGMELQESKFDFSGKDKFYMVDFTLQPDEKMVDFRDRTGHSLVWIDHHETALATERNRGLEDTKGLRQSGLAGCELTWQYYFEAAIPKFIEYIGKWDTWRNDDNTFWEHDIVPFQLYLSSLDLRPSHNLDWWFEKLYQGAPTDYGKITVQHAEEFLDKGVHDGHSIQRYVERQADSNVRKGFKGKFAGVPAYFINRGENSRIFEKYDEAKGLDLWVTYTHHKGTYWMISLYSNKPGVHCGEICKRLGEAGPIPSGGGHAGAAGFQTTWEYFWSLVEVDKFKELK